VTARISHLVGNVLSEELPTISHAAGVFVFDATGKRYLDGCSGAVTANLGHGNPRMLEALTTQASRVTFAHRGAFTNQPAEDLAHTLSELTGYPHVLLAGSGSEAVEAAMRFVLQYWREQGQLERSSFSSHRVGYHGATIGGLSLSGNPVRRDVASSLLFDFNILPPPYHYRFGNGLSESEFAMQLIEEAGLAFETKAERHAAVVIEPVGGAAGGAVTPPDGYLRDLSSLCKANGVPLVADEVMCGLGRTGRLLAAEHWGVRPDVVVLGKGLGAGYSPISAVLLTEEMMAPLAAGSAVITNGHTYSGNPLSAAAALRSLEILVEDDLIACARIRGGQLREGLEKLAVTHPVIGEARGLGLLQGIELVTDRSQRTPGAPIGSLTSKLVRSAKEVGLLLYPANGGFNDAVLVAPPLTVSEAEITLLLELLDEALRAFD
jgi:adenosylmethionine-8-amino-7-oxononanoate aminotransferase